jgi:phage terminase large subunit-like protein
VASLPKVKRAELERLVLEHKYRWSLHAREKQILPSGDWSVWMLKAGRGFGKTRAGVEAVREWKNAYPLIGLIGATAADVRDIMIEGESGILAMSPPWDIPLYEPSKKKLTFSNGSIVKLFSAEEPDRLRGPQFYKLWCDELAAWKYDREAWDNGQMANRLGVLPQTIVTTTPRPTKLIRELVKDKHTHLTHGTTYENRNNLAPSWYETIIKQYEGTRLGRQELMAEILEDVEGALWTIRLIEENRVKEHPELKRIVVAIDPAVTANKNSDETGIVITGLGIDEKGYVLNDASGIFTPNNWAKRAIYNYYKYNADRIVAEVNNGGDLVEVNIRIVDKNVPYKDVRASRNKTIRAEPITALYEQGRIKHVGGFPKLEDEMVTWDGTNTFSPGRLDALVWGFTELMLEKKVNTNQWA